MRKLFTLFLAIVATNVLFAQIADVSVYADCSKNGYTKDITIKQGIASVSSSSGRTSCNYVRLWEGGPKWATFNVGATITNYTQLSVGADPVSFWSDEKDLEPYYNTANVGGLYPWKNPNLNGRYAIWENALTPTGISDIATTIWGSNWQTPTKGQLDTLLYGNIDWTWCDGSTTQYIAGCTLKGFKITGKGAYADCSIFLPAAGLSDSTGLSGAGKYCEYWSSTEADAKWELAYGLDYGRNGISRYSSLHGYYKKAGSSVRAVYVGETSDVNNVTLSLYVKECDSVNVITCSAGQQIRITAQTKSKREKFTRWSDGNTDNPRVIVVTQDTAFTAEFADDQYTVSISSNDSIAGIVSGSGTYDILSNVTIMAAASAVGYKFDKWSDGVTLAGRQITLTSDTTLIAYFISADEVECIEVEENNALLGTADIQIIATPNKGAQFTQWSDGNTDNPRIVTNAPGLYTAIFSNTATKTSSITADQQNAIQKRIVDDQLIIQRDGKMYNAQGGEL